MKKGSSNLMRVIQEPPVETAQLDQQYEYVRQDVLFSKRMYRANRKAGWLFAKQVVAQAIFEKLNK